MIHGVFGKLGSGKGLYVMDIIAKELMDGFRDVVTNVPVRTMPWVNGQGIPMIGLRAYLLEVLSPLSEDEIDEILKRVRIDEEMENGSDLFLWRRDGETGEWFKCEVTKKDDKGRAERFDPQEIKRRHAAPVLCVTDEAWAFYPNNGGWTRAPILNFYSRQQRKLRDEWYIVTQHPTDIDEVFWKIAQDFHVCRNHGMERLGIFRQPAGFSVIVYRTNPAKANAIKSHEIWRFLDKKLCQCYDTTGGVGTGGGLAGDAGQKKKGLHIAWLVAAILLVCVCLMSVPFLVPKLCKPFMMRIFGAQTETAKKVSSVSPPALSPAPAVSVPAPVVVPVPRPARSARQDVPDVYCTGFAFVDGRPEAFLSDGSVSESPELSEIGRTWVVVDGVKLRIRLSAPKWTARPDPPVPTAPAFTPAYAGPAQADFPPVNQADVTVIGDGWASRHQPPARIGGMLGQSVQKQ